MSNLVLILSEGALATATWTATVRESATLQTRADFSATWTGEFFLRASEQETSTMVIFLLLGH